MKRKLITILLSVLLLPVFGYAQFYPSSNNPASLKWYQIHSPNYKIIFPEGLDSLAKEYALNLEKYSLYEAPSSGYIPNQSYKKRMPVILHSHTSNANGSVIWTPRRMELNTLPNAYNMEAMPWIENLAIHESRHVAQMQVGRDRSYKPFHYLVGEMYAGAVAALYSGPTFLEGDAVVMETALSRAGRGRSASFLEYYKIAFDQGDWRDWYKWNYGSLKQYSPNHYALGYLTIAGMRTLYDDPLFVKRYYDNIFLKKYWPFPLFNLDKTIKEVSGKNRQDTFLEIAQSFQKQWDMEAKARAPFMQSEEAYKQKGLYYSYSNSVSASDSSYSVLMGLDRLPKLINLNSGKTLRLFSASTSSLKWSDVTGKLYWSEIINDPRWGKRSYSLIRSFDPKSGKTKNISRKSHYHHPAASPDQEILSVTEYMVEGGSSISLINANDGTIIKSYDAPDSLQIVESVFSGERLVTSALSPSGFGLYDAFNAYECLLSPQAVSIERISAQEDLIYFVSDRNGVNEVYSFDITQSKLIQLTNTRYGISDYFFSPDKDSLYYSVPSEKGRSIMKTAISSLHNREVEYGDIHIYPVAEELSKQEKELSSDIDFNPDDIVLSEVKPYNKLANSIKFHSWAPVYFNYDKVMSLSFDKVSEIAKFGAMGFFQNELSTLYGYAGVSKDEFKTSISYSGLYPVFEAEFETDYKEKTTGSLNTYVPLSFNSGGYFSGIIPEINYKYYSSNNQRLLLMTRAYFMTGQTSVSPYPKFGIGIELGSSMKLSLAHEGFSSSYLYSYAYLPGFVPQHGLRLSTIWQKKNPNSSVKEFTAFSLPRGMKGYFDIYKYICENYSSFFMFSADYAMTLACLDWSFLSPVTYFRSLEGGLHIDATSLLYSVGGELSFRLANLAWLPYDSRIGITYSYNGGRIWEKLNKDIPELDRNYVAMIFSVDF